jgi:hypothetical protein
MQLSNFETNYLKSGGRLFAVIQDEDTRWHVADVKEDGSIIRYLDDDGYDSADQANNLCYGLYFLTTSIPLLRTVDEDVINDWKSDCREYI